MEASAGSGSWDHTSDIETASTPSSTTIIVACGCAFTLPLQSTWTAILAQIASLVSEPTLPFRSLWPLASDRSYKIGFIVCATALPVRRAVPISSCHGRRARNRQRATSFHYAQGIACMSNVCADGHSAPTRIFAAYDPCRIDVSMHARATPVAVQLHMHCKASSLAFDIHGLALARHSKAPMNAWLSRCAIMSCLMM